MQPKTADILEVRRQKWQSKEILRRLYAKWFARIQKSIKPGIVLELGAGSGHLRDFLPEAIMSDVTFAPWLDATLDAHDLPFKGESIDNIVLFDVLHHLRTPVFFFQETLRVLRQGGRLVMAEPYVSSASFFVYRFLHSEGMSWHVDPFDTTNSREKAPFDGNQAVPTLIFEKYRRKFMHRFPGLRIMQEERTDSLLYPLSGGFHQPSLCPRHLWGAMEYLEGLLAPMSGLLAFRLFLTLEKGKRVENRSPAGRG